MREMRCVTITAPNDLDIADWRVWADPWQVMAALTSVAIKSLYALTGGIAFKVRPLIDGPPA